MGAGSAAVILGLLAGRFFIEEALLELRLRQIRRRSSPRAGAGK
jgi:hypothetical protein